ncbi:5-hydroxytryptamine receptor-like [Anopheles cruzii]|uniref:5-hydroxytryptamine receptor-like n=1 Tax=Anopheles cruzii TaxID=68878 RepID=UPI0022EC25C8|nr:5-hydroxytryptamine receptor-like [Anopheles cruzii]
MALMDGGSPTNESFAWTALLPRSRDQPASPPTPRVTYEFPPATVLSSAPPSVTSYSALPSTTTATWSAYVRSTGPTASPTLGNASYSEPYTSPGTATTTAGGVVVDQLSLADVPSTPFPADRSPLASVTATVQNLTRTLLGNYSAGLDADYGGDEDSSNSTLGASSLMPRGIALSLPDLLEEDELMALLNCTNCFLLNYGATGSAGNNTTTGRYDPNGTTLSPADDDDAFASETTIYLIRVIATAVVLGIVILATVIGNVFVIAAILLERNLQSVANHLILSLAVADLLVACLVMPLGAVYEVSKEWRLGADLCDMWTSSDVLCCTASILHLVAIALDRYWAVTDIDYAHQRTSRRIGYMIIIIWTLSVLVSIAPLLGWKDPEWEARVYQDLQCIVSQDVGYQIFATASSFYVPLLVILFLYWRIFLAARKRIRRRQQAAQTHPEPLAKASCMALTTIGFRWKVNATQTASGGGMIANVAGGSGGIAAAVVAVIGRPLPTISETTTAFTNVSSANTSPEKGSLGNGIERDRIEIDPPTADISMAYPSGTQASCSSSARPPGSLASKKKAQSSTDSKRERKAAKTLAIITGAFVCCWLPFFIIAILLPTCTSCDISPFVTSVCLWLGYFNSTLNPIIYTIFSPEFRHAFKRILCGRRYSLRRTRNMGVRHMR